MKILHTADLHFSNTPDKLEESVRTTDFILDQAEAERPDVIILAGDTIDEHDGRIRIDSDTARAAISFVQRAADIAPVIMVRGTKSHDRDTPYLFQHLNARHPIHVSDKIEMVALIGSAEGAFFVPLESAISNPYPRGPGQDPTRRMVAAFTCIPSLDKSALIAGCEGMGIREANAEGRSLFGDIFASLGEVNAGIAVPRIMVGHGMITGAEFSSGQSAIGEDLEYGVGDIRRGGFDYVAMGHVHKFQKFPGNIYYSGSPGRMNFGEKEEKGFIIAEFAGQGVKEVRFVPTPARRFVFAECSWEAGGLEEIEKKADECEAECAGADVRFRFTVPEEEKHRIDRAGLEKRFTEAGARKVKIECQVLPVVRQRAAGISRLSTLPEKVARWGEVTEQEIPERTLDIAAVIEGRDVEELMADALLRIDEEQAPDATDEAEVHQAALNY